MTAILRRTPLRALLRRRPRYVGRRRRPGGYLTSTTVPVYTSGRVACRSDGLTRCAHSIVSKTRLMPTLERAR